MRAIWSTDEEITAILGPDAEASRNPAGTGQSQPAADAQTDRSGTATPEARPNLELTGQTKGQIRGEEAQRARQQADQRVRDNAPSPDEFTLTGSNRAADVGAAHGQVAMFSRSTNTKSAYEARIDALFDGEKARAGTRVLDRSDVMGLLGYPDVPLLLNERHLLDGQTQHPEMTTALWKQVPEWLESPAAVYTDPNHPGRLTVIAPQKVAGFPVVMAVEPNPTPAQRGKSDPFQLLVTVFAKTTGHLPALRTLATDGRLRYADTKNAPAMWLRAGDNPRTGNPLAGAPGRILTEKNLAGYRRAQSGAMFQRAKAMPTEAEALKAFSELPDLFHNVKSDRKDLAGVARDIDPRLDVSKGSNIVGEQLYTITRPGYPGEARALALWLRASSRCLALPWLFFCC